MNEWKEYKLEEILNLVKDTYSPNNLDELFYIGLEHIEQDSLRLNGVGKSTDVTSNKFQFEINDVLFGKLRPYFRKVVKVKIKGICSTDIWVFRAKEGFSQDFIFYFLANYDFVNLANNGEAGTRMPRADWNFLKTTIWNIPPLPEQRAIAAVLSSLDDKIDLLHRQNKTLEAMAETLFRQWFVEEAGEDWASFSMWIENTFGGEWGKENAENDFTEPVYCIRGTDIADLQTGLAEKTPLRYVKLKKFQNIEPQEGDIILEISGGTETQSTGRAIYINHQVKSFFNRPLVFSNFCRLIRPIKKEFCFFLYLYIQYLYKQDEFFSLENGTSGIKNLDYKALLFELKFKMPNELKVLDFNNKVSAFFQKINQNKSQIRTLTQTRDVLLPKLMSGEIRIKI